MEILVTVFLKTAFICISVFLLLAFAGIIQQCTLALEQEEFDNKLDKWKFILSYILNELNEIAMTTIQHRLKYVLFYIYTLVIFFFY